MESASASSAAYHTEFGRPGNTRNQVLPDGLTDYSPRDKPWDVHRAQADRVSDIYGEAEEFERYAKRIHACSGALFFAWLAHEETGELVLRLREARFCRCRYCPVCQWRRSLMHQARFLEALPKIQADHPGARWLFLTLTVRNCSIQELGETLTAMNAAWHRLVKRGEFSPVQGWIRSTEVTRGADGSAHPHFHCLLMVRPSWFTRHYVKHERWVSLWRACARLDYDPVVRIQSVKPKRGRPEESALRDAAAETLKYSVKPSDMTDDAGWFLELTRQTHKRRFLAAGGALKDVLKRIETEDDLIHADDDAQGDAGDDGARLAFAWRSEQRRYRRAPDRDRGQ